MTPEPSIEPAQHTNGRARVERQIAETRDVLRGSTRSQRRVRPAKLIVPALLALGVVFILRRFEQSTGN